MIRPVHLLTAAPLALALTPPSAAQLRLPNVLSDGMVLQQAAEVPVWGWAEPGATVAVSLSRKGPATNVSSQVAQVTAGDDGRWQVALRTGKAGGPYELVAASGDETVRVQDVLLGEVWLCSGQSNMEWELSKTIEAARASGALGERTANLERPEIRFFDVPKTHAATPRDDVDARWWAADGEDALRCSAVAYHFGCELQDTLDVPIGLVVTSWGGTTAQAWTSAEVVSRFPDHAAAIERVRASDPAAQDRRVDEFWAEVTATRFWSSDFASPDFDDSGWETQVQPAPFEEGPVGEHDGVVWYRRTVEVPPAWEARELRLELPPIDDADETYWNGVRIASTIEPGGWSKPRRYVVPAALVTAGPATIAIRAIDTGGPGGFKAVESTGERPAMYVTGGEVVVDLTGPWKVRRGTDVSKLPALPMPAAVNQHTPSGLYNGMIQPLLPYAVCGMIWYQGESNRARAEEYYALFPAMIVDWRTRWGDLELPFYFVQLAPFEYGSSDAGGRTAMVREAQARTAETLPATGMALTADIGNPRDIHPKNKWTVGERLARFAKRDVYGMTDVIADGPKLRGVAADGATLRVELDHVNGRLSPIGETLAHFEIAGETGDYVAATARISDDGQAILLTADGVEAPRHARYLWDDSAEATVMGGAGLPLAPFRTR